MRKFKRFYKKGFNNRGKKPPFKKGGPSSSLFKARCFKCNSTDHLVADCPKAIEKEKGALEAKLEVLKRKKKGKGLIGTWDQDSSEKNEVQSSPFNSSNLIDDFVMMILVPCLLKCMVNAKRFPKETKS
ncbi:hypothetical protein M9H77_35914 [Catharanthus roseus]|uniref:Uncharacterized protein n=1 Tax=Catharanthus roseus TaxID=4058 RepID=A0ACB9ZQC9_CATRO|nr:hypothetical protein M9H77_35914 [Catharanthus roseus]